MYFNIIRKGYHLLLLLCRSRSNRRRRRRKRIITLTSSSYHSCRCLAIIKDWLWPFIVIVDNDAAAATSHISTTTSTVDAIIINWSIIIIIIRNRYHHIDGVLSFGSTRVVGLFSRKKNFCHRVKVAVHFTFCDSIVRSCVVSSPCSLRRRWLPIKTNRFFLFCTFTIIQLDGSFEPLLPERSCTTRVHTIIVQLLQCS